MTTGSGVEYAPRLVVSKLRAPGHTNRNIAILGHTLPPSAGVDGLLGLDFFRGRILTINFKSGVLELDSNRAV